MYKRQAFILNDRWVQYIQGVGTTLLVTAIALALGVVCLLYTSQLLSNGLGGVDVDALKLTGIGGHLVRLSLIHILMAVDPGQMEAGRSLGLNYMTTRVVIVIPQASRAVLPALGNEFIVLLKDTRCV